MDVLVVFVIVALVVFQLKGVRQVAGHRSLKIVLCCTQLIVVPQNEEYICKVVKDVVGVKGLIEAGLGCVADLDGCELFRKMKTSYLGSLSL